MNLVMKMQTIKNEFLEVKINELGAELMSIKASDGTEYLWQGDPKYWRDRAPNIFPYVARLTDGKYTLFGNTYEMKIHGFAKSTLFSANCISESEVILTITENKETLKMYPYSFELSVHYRLEGNKLINEYIVKNRDNKQMYFGLGGHPGFNVPFADNTKFEDYYLQFAGDGTPTRIGFSETCFITGNDAPFKLEAGNKISLKHDMFDEDAIVLKGTAKCVTLKSDKTEKSVKVSFPNMKYIGFWHRPKTDAPYVCIEPWSSLPSRQDIIEDLATQPDLVSLEADGEYKDGFTIEIF